MEGKIVDAMGGGQYSIEVYPAEGLPVQPPEGGSHPVVRGQLSGRLRRHHIRVLPGDNVIVAVSPYDLTHGLIVYRGRRKLKNSD